MSRILLEPIKRIKRPPNKVGGAIIMFIVCVFTIILIVAFVGFERDPLMIFVLIACVIGGTISIFVIIKGYKNIVNEKHIETSEEYYEKKYGKKRTEI